MSYFNEDQRDHMRSLAATPDELRCWCGWNAKGHCHNGSCPPTLSRADKVPFICTSCGSAPMTPGGDVVHYRFCATLALEVQL